MKDRIIALAALLQAVEQVQLMANQGQAQTEPLRVCINSLFMFDANDCEHIYGSASQLKPGLRILDSQLQENNQRNAGLTRIAMNVLQLERAFSKNKKALSTVHEQLNKIQSESAELDCTHPEVLAKIGTLYAERISPLGPKIMVQGNPVYLAQTQVVSEVRATLLAAVRAAVLWRQMGGSFWDFFLARRKLLQATKQLQTGL